MKFRVVQIGDDMFFEADKIDREKLKQRIHTGHLVLIGDELYATAEGMRVLGKSEDEVHEAEALIRKAKLEVINRRRTALLDFALRCRSGMATSSDCGVKWQDGVGSTVAWASVRCEPVGSC